MALKSRTEKILLKIMTKRSLIAKIRSKNALITKTFTAENRMVKGPATKISRIERTTANSLEIKTLTIKRRRQKKTNSEKYDRKQYLGKKSDTEESSVKILVKRPRAKN